MASLKLSTPIVLEGAHVRLEPLSEAHADSLARIGLDEEIWRHMPYGPIRTPDAMHAWIAGVLALTQRGTDIPFVVLQKPTGEVAGATRYMDIRKDHLGLEIGGTWYGAQFRRTAVNTECKYLLLKHAFETMECIRVQFKTDLRNERSQRAIERIGAKREGVLRNHMILPDGTIRHSVYYSILDSEWAATKSRLEQLISR